MAKGGQLEGFLSIILFYNETGSIKKKQEKIILKDRVLTQSATDIHRKLLKWAYGPNQS